MFLDVHFSENVIENIGKSRMDNGEKTKMNCNSGVLGMKIIEQTSENKLLTFK